MPASSAGRRSANDRLCPGPDGDDRRPPSPIAVGSSFPESGVTKGDLADYYATIAPLMLPFLRDRPISLVRCPQGEGENAFSKNMTQAASVIMSSGYRSMTRTATPTIIFTSTTVTGWPPAYRWRDRIPWLGFDGVWSRDARPMVFDLDPDEGLAFDDTRAAAEHLKEQLAALGLTSFPMLSGGKGNPRYRTPHAQGGLAGNKEFRRTVCASARIGRSDALRGHDGQIEAVRAYLHRLAPQPAWQHRDHALFGPGTGKCPVCHTDIMGRTAKNRNGGRMDAARRGQASAPRRQPRPRRLGAGSSNPSRRIAANVQAHRQRSQTIHSALGRGLVPAPVFGPFQTTTGEPPRFVGGSNS